MAGLRVRRGNPRWLGADRLLQNRIQECHQFGRSQDSTHADASPSPRLDDGPTAQPPAAVTAGGRPDRPGPLAWEGPLAGRRMLARPELSMVQMPGWLAMLDRMELLGWVQRLAGLQGLAGLQVVAGSRAFANPDGAGPQHAPQFTAARKVGPVPCAEREVFVIVVPQAAPGAPGMHGGRGRKPVVRVGPGGLLAGIQPRCGDPLG